MASGLPADEETADTFRCAACRAIVPIPKSPTELIGFCDTHKVPLCLSCGALPNCHCLSARIERRLKAEGR
jgi:hypothetical protein